jgi:hypothetical protein
MMLIREKYAKRLPDVFAALKKEDPYYSSVGPFVSALVHSSLPVAIKKKLLLEALESSEEGWQAEALDGLRRIDVDEFHQRLITTFADLPGWKDKRKDADLYPACHTCFAEVAMGTDDAKVWEAVSKYLADATAEVKIEWISYLTGRTERKDRHFLRVVACVAALLSDKAFRVEKNGDRVGSTEVRNYAANLLGNLLRVRGMPTADAPADEWAAFREEVAKAAEKVTKKRS